jgi:hypothetical protein
VEDVQDARGRDALVSGGDTVPSEETGADALVESLWRLPTLQDLGAELTDLGVDVVLDNEIVRELPIVHWLVALSRGVISYREQRFAKKLIRLLFGVGRPTESDIAQWKQRLTNDRGARETGDVILSVVDNATSAWKAELVGRMWRSYLDGDCDQESFRRIIEMINNALTDDLRYLLEHWDPIASNPVVDRLVAVGLLSSRGMSLLNAGDDPSFASVEGKLLIGAARNPPAA